MVGHKNPDTDSICSAIAYAYLKRQVTGEKYEPRRAGHINEETAYVLKRFNVEAPKYLADVKLQMRDLDIHEIEGIDPNCSIKETWRRMQEDHMKTLPVLKDGELQGVITTGDIAKSYMEVYDTRVLAEAKTQYKNIIETLEGELITGNPHAYFTNGKVTVAASSSDIMTTFTEKDDLVISGNRYEAHSCAVDVDASCIIICNSGTIAGRLLERAKEQQIVVISTHYDTFTAARLINQSIPVKYIMTKGPLTVFKMNDYAEDIKSRMTKQKFRDFPIVDKHGKFVGFISRRRFMNSTRKQVILVDHNEKSQAVDGIDEADIIEIVDHHRLGNIETMGPVFFRNQPVGCTATIISQMFEENAIEIPDDIAGLLICAIISDTLMFRSPTCTPLDTVVAVKLARKINVDIEELADAMFKAGSSLNGKTPEEICFMDFKQFTVGDITFGVGQVNSMDEKELLEIKGKLQPILDDCRRSHGLQMIFFLLTNIMEESSEILCSGEGAREKIVDAFGVSEESENLFLKDIVSRKKQVIPALVSIMQQ